MSDLHIHYHDAQCVIVEKPAGRLSVPGRVPGPNLADQVRAALRDDFQRMIGAGMFIGEPPAFDTIVDRLRALETAINQSAGQDVEGGCGQLRARHV